MRWFRVIGLSVVSLMFCAVVGCNTMEGIGEDLEATGDALSDAARDAK